MPRLSDDELFDKLHEYMRYDDDTGELVWKKARCGRTRVESVVGSPNSEGYLCTRFFGGDYKVHRLVWFMHHRKWPDGQIDHIDRNPCNNRLSNLRDVTGATNSQNRGGRSDNNTGTTGVSYVSDGRSSPWRVSISRHGKVIHRQHYATEQEAVDASTRVYQELAGN